MAELFSVILGIITFVALLQLFGIASTLKQLLTVAHLVLELLQKASDGRQKAP